jgi:flagellar export protein FliJ
VATRFRFRLQSLLKLRRSLEEAAQRELARVLALLDEARAQRAQLLRTQLETVESLGTPTRQQVDLERWRAAERFLWVLERRIAAARNQVREAETRVAAARQELLRAHRAHLMLERLRERRQEQHALEQLREEARDMDEMAVLRYRLSPASRGPSAREVTS